MIDDDADFQFSAVAKYAIVLLQKISHLVILIGWLISKPRQIFIIFAIILVTLLMIQLSQRTEALPTADLQSDRHLCSSPQWETRTFQECTKKCEDLRRQCKKALLDADNMATGIKLRNRTADATFLPAKAHETYHGKGSRAALKWSLFQVENDDQRVLSH